MKKVIIFDFDGVLADSFDTFYPLVEDAMEQIGLSITPKKYRDLFIDNVHKGFKNLIKNKKKLGKFLEFRRTHYDKYYYDKKLKAKLFPKASEFIKVISRKYILSIASSGKQDNIRDLLKEEKIEKLFGLILADSNHSKEIMIREISNKFRCKPEQTFFITDTVGDIKVAKKCGLKTIAVTWGFHNKKYLRAAKPDYIASSFQQLTQILNLRC